MNFLTKLTLLIISVFFIGHLQGQTTTENDLTVEQVISEVLLGDEIDAFNITINGQAANTVIPSVGTFSSPGAPFGMEEGMVMATKSVDIVTCGPEAGGQPQGYDIDLESLVSNSSLYNVSVIEFDFIPSGDSISFDFVFASREYHIFVCSAFNDVFGFFISGPGINGPFSNDAENIARVPGSGEMVAINTVNNGDFGTGGLCITPEGETCPCNAAYFINNGGGEGNGLASDICFGGYTTPIKASSSVQCGEVYHMKLAIANVSDGIYESAVFLEKGSFIVSEPDWDSPECADPEACNYNPESTCNWGCQYPGCTDPTACNYNPNTSCDDGSCIYDTAYYSGYVYHDVNGDGSYNSQLPFPEPKLSNWEIQLEPLGISIFTDNDGYYEFDFDPATPQTLTLIDNSDVFDPLSSAVGVELFSPDCDSELNLGVASEENIFLSAAAPWVSFIHCSNGTFPGLYINNLGTDSLSGALTLTVDSPLNADMEVTVNGIAPDNIDGQIVTWNITDHPPGQQIFYNCKIEGPGVEYVDSTFTFLFDLTINDDNEESIYENSWTTDQVVLCAYDPNDKLADPVGYAEPHFILAEDEIEYTVRFQNTGNFQANTVLVVDTLDMDRLDINTFSPVFSSHNMVAKLKSEEGVAEFLFENINLPDSATDPLGSQGYLRFKIRTKSGLAAGEVINNSAGIYFDENPPIITNTTWHTIFECEGLAAFVPSELPCAGQEFTLNASEDFIESYHWTINGEDAGNGQEITIVPGPGELNIELSAVNPLCEDQHDLTFLLLAQPEGEITMQGTTLSAPLGTAWEWYLNGELIPDADGQSIDYSASGLYSVHVYYGNDCFVVFDMTITNMGENSHPDISVFPNPTEETATLLLGNHFWNVEIFDVNGRLVRGYEQVTDRLFIGKQQFGAGTYFIHVEGSTEEGAVLRLVIQ